MGEENMDYKTLVVFLREHAKHNGDCDSCPWRDAEDRGFEVCSEEMAAKAADAIEELIAALTASNEVIAKSKPKWIPVTERLVKNNKNLVATIYTKRPIRCCGGYAYNLYAINGGYTTECLCGGFCGQFSQDPLAAARDFENIIHGTAEPLPEPPEEDEE